MLVEGGAEKEYVCVLLATNEVTGEESNVLGRAVIRCSLVEDLNNRLRSSNELGALSGLVSRRNELNELIRGALPLARYLSTVISFATGRNSGARSPKRYLFLLSEDDPSLNFSTILHGIQSMKLTKCLR